MPSQNTIKQKQSETKEKERENITTISHTKVFDFSQYARCITSAYFLIQWFRFSSVNNTEEKAPQFDQRKSMNGNEQMKKKNNAHNEIESAHTDTRAQTTLTADSLLLLLILLYIIYKCIWFGALKYINKRSFLSIWCVSRGKKIVSIEK